LDSNVDAAKHPSSNIQAPVKFQHPNFKVSPCEMKHGLVLGAWCFSGAWMLELGAFPVPSFPNFMASMSNFQQETAGG
jgi:hypothetical protein